MIYLIGGVSKAGKSFISKKIMEEHKIPYFQTDFLLWGLGDFNDEGLFNYFDDDDKTSKILEPYILKIIYFLNLSNTNYVIEGTHITVELCKKLKEIYKDNVKECFIGYPKSTSKDKIKEINNNISKLDNTWFKLLSDEDFNNFIENEIKRSSLIKDECEKENLKFFEIENIEKDYNSVEDYLIKK